MSHDSPARRTAPPPNAMSSSPWEPGLTSDERISRMESGANAERMSRAQRQNDGSGMGFQEQSRPTDSASTGAVQPHTASHWGVQAPNSTQSPYGNQAQYFNSQPYAMPNDLTYQTPDSLDQFSPAQVPQHLWQQLQQLPPQAPQQPAPSFSSSSGSSTHESTLDPALLDPALLDPALLDPTLQTFPQTTSPQEAVQQGTIIQQSALQQPIPPEVFGQQAAIPLDVSQQGIFTQQPIFQQPISPEVFGQQAALPLDVSQQGTFTQQPIFQQPIFQQPIFQQPVFQQDINLGDFEPQAAISQTATPQVAAQQATITQQPTFQQPIFPDVSGPQAAIPLQASQQVFHQQLYTEETFQQPVQPSSSQQDTTQAYQPEVNQFAPASDYAPEFIPQPEVNQLAPDSEHAPEFIPQPEVNQLAPDSDYAPEFIPQPEVNQIAPASDYAQESYPQAAIPAHYHTYEEKWAAFRPVPELHPNPFPKEGKSGRKPKPQRFWPHPDASEDLRRRYSELQQADANVTKAEKKLEKNSRPSQDAHFQNILLRNMATRDNLWTMCERMEQGKAAVELSVEAAGAKTKKCHKAWTKIRDGLTKKEALLGTEYPSAVNHDGTINTRLVEHQTGQGLQTRRNWNQKHIKDLRDAFDALRNALLRRHGDDEHLPKRVLKHAHDLGCYPGFVDWMWPGDTEEGAIYRTMYEDPDESTWMEGPMPTLGQGQQDGQMQDLQEVLEMPENPQFVEGPEGAHDIAHPEPQAAQQETDPMPEQVYDQVQSMGEQPVPAPMPEQNNDQMQFVGEQPVPAPMPEQNNDQMQFVGEQPLDAPMPDQNDDQMQFVGEQPVPAPMHVPEQNDDQMQLMPSEQPVAAPMPEQNDDQDAEMVDGGEGSGTSDSEDSDWDAPDAFTASLNEIGIYISW